VPVTDPATCLQNLRLEREAIWLYDRLAAIEKDRGRAAAFRRIAANDRRHAATWETVLAEAGVVVPPDRGPRPRIRFIAFLARVFGTGSVGDMVRALEGDEERYYAEQAWPGSEAIIADEREHAETWSRLAAERAAAGDVAIGEQWHRAGRSGTFRAVIFGVSDGLVSNLALVMGVAGASAEGSFVLLAGVAGLLAGAFSMAAGEYISMQSQRELFERQIQLERAELEAMPDEQEAELAAVYRAKGFPDDEARRVAERLMVDPEMALSTLVREELGLNPDELGSPWGAAGGSFVAFALGAIVPVVPYLFGNGPVAFWTSLIVSLIALFGVGAGVSLLTGRGLLFSGLRQAGIGLGAAIVTYAVGSLIGVGVA
jgi:VIT1/CCC1 family predicted Fe2+/Mn2+ transporter